jgi:hypothetical protein
MLHVRTYFKKTSKGKVLKARARDADSHARDCAASRQPQLLRCCRAAALRV